MIVSLFAGVGTVTSDNWSRVIGASDANEAYTRMGVLFGCVNGFAPSVRTIGNDHHVPWSTPAPVTT
jgi:hypothetical protein